MTESLSRQHGDANSDGVDDDLCGALATVGDGAGGGTFRTELSVRAR